LLFFISRGPGSPQLAPRGTGRSFRPFPRPELVSPLRLSRSGVNGPGLIFPTLPASSAARSASRLHRHSRFAPVLAASLPRARCRFPGWLPQLLSQRPLPFRAFPPFRIDVSTGSAAGRPAFRLRPIPVRSPPPLLFLGWLRITVPGSLRFRRLAVPQTSWNLTQNAPIPVSGQDFLRASAAISSENIPLCFESVTPVILCIGCG
jgi:hypothetical protein